MPARTTSQRKFGLLGLQGWGWGVPAAGSSSVSGKKEGGSRYFLRSHHLPGSLTSFLVNVPRTMFAHTGGK